MRRVLGALGRACVTLGLLILLFVAYQLWGTGLYTARAQDRLESQFEEALRARPRAPAPTSGGPPTTIGPGPASTTTTVPGTPPAPRLEPGLPVAQIVIPKIGIDYFVVEGVGVPDLRKGPGHYPTTPLPGQSGNAAIAGHRTTYGAPFGNLGEVGPGDRITVRTVQGTFEYAVYEQVVVKPKDVFVLERDPLRPATLTLTTCNPKYSAAERLVVKATLELPPGARPLPPTASGAAIDLSATDGDPPSRRPTILWGLVVALVGAAWWLLFHRHPSWRTWLLGVVPFAAVLLVFYANLERTLPANY